VRRFQAERGGEPAPGRKALRLVCVAAALGQPVKAHHQHRSAAVFGPVPAQVGGERVDVRGVIVEVAYQPRALWQDVGHALGGAFGVLRVKRHHRYVADTEARERRSNGGRAIAHSVAYGDAELAFKKPRLPGGVEGKGGTLGGPDRGVLLGRLCGAGAQHDAVQEGQPQPTRQLDHPRVGEEFGQIGAHGRRRGRRRRAEIDEENALQCCESALESSFAVMSTIGITRSYAMRVGPMTPTVPTTSPSTL
jgi:hypothetical protein